MEAPKTVVNAMVSTSSADMSWVEDGYGLSDGVTMHRAPSFAEWAGAACGAQSTQQHKLFLELMRKMLDRTISAQESKVFDAMRKKADKRSDCEFSLVTSNRDRLQPP
jgi:hypothetical protein